MLLAPAHRYTREQLMGLHTLSPLTERLPLIEGVTTRNCLYPALLDPIDPEEVLKLVYPFFAEQGVCVALGSNTGLL